MSNEVDFLQKNSWQQNVWNKRIVVGMSLESLWDILHPTDPNHMDEMQNDPTFDLRKIVDL